MNDEKEVRELLERTVHKYTQMEKQKRTYGTDMELTQAEIHTIAYIGENVGTKQEALVRSKGITKGAASQMITKLVSKGLVERRSSKTSHAEVALFLTEAGIQAFKGHQLYHEQVDNNFRNLFMHITKEEYDAFVKVLKICDEKLGE